MQHILRFISYTVLTIISLNHTGAQSIKNNFLKQDYFEKIIHDNNRPVISRVNCIDSILTIQIKPSQKIGWLLKKGELLFESGMMSRSLDVYDRLYNDCDKLSESERLLVTYRLSASSFFCSDYNKALRLTFDIINNQKNDSLKYFDALAYINAANIFSRSNMPHEAQKYIQEARKWLSKPHRSIPTWRIDDIRGALHASNSLAEMKNNDFAKAFDELRECEKYAHSPGTILCVDVNRAMIYHKMGESPAAKALYEDILEKDVIHYNSGVAVSNYLDLLVGEKNYEEAIKTYNLKKPLTELIKGDIIESYLHRNLSDAYAGLHDYEAAYAELKKSMLISDSIFSVDNEARIKKLSDDFRMQQMENVRTSLEHNNSTNRIIIIALIVSLVVFVGIYFIILHLYFRRNKEKDRIETQIDTLTESHKKEVHDSNMTIDTQKRELTSITMQLAQINDTINKVIDMIGDDSKKDSEKLSAIRLQLHELDLQKDIWDVFSLYFNRTHQNFLKSLYKSHPNLTAGEVRMCAFIIMNLQTKDIAKIINRSARTIDSIKYRLHKRLGIDEPTEVYLRRFLTQLD